MVLNDSPPRSVTLITSSVLKLSVAAHFFRPTQSKLGLCSGVHCSGLLSQDPAPLGSKVPCLSVPTAAPSHRVVLSLGAIFDAPCLKALTTPPHSSCSHKRLPCASSLQFWVSSTTVLCLTKIHMAASVWDAAWQVDPHPRRNQI